MELKDRKRCSICNKEIYESEEQAREELFRILETQKKISDIKPCRSYYSEKCGGWHLTSKIKIDG